MIASVGFSITGSSRSSTRMSRAAWSTAPRMVIPFFRAVSGGVPGSAPHGWSAGAEDLLGDGHRGHRLRPAGIEGQVGDGLDELLLGGAVVLGVLQMEGELLGVAAGSQRRDGDQTAVAWRQLRALPRLTEQDVVGEAQSGAPRAGREHRVEVARAVPGVLAAVGRVDRVLVDIGGVFEGGVVFGAACADAAFRAALHRLVPDPV